MKHPTVAPLPDPLYRLRRGERGRLAVDVVRRTTVDWSDSCYGCPEGVHEHNDFHEVAVVGTRESAMAVLRLFEVTEIHDWTQQGAHWDMPLTRLGAA